MRYRPSLRHLCLLMMPLLVVSCVRGLSPLPSNDGARAGDAVRPRVQIPEDCSEPVWPIGNTVVRVLPGDRLERVIEAATPGTSIVLADGSYIVGSPVRFSVPGIILRGESGSPERVTIDATGTDTPFTIAASDVVVASLSIIKSRGTPIVVTGAAGADIRGTVLYRLLLADRNAPLIRVEPNVSTYADDGVIACSALAINAGFRASLSAICSVSGISLEGARGWRIRDNSVRGMWCPGGILGAAMVFAYGSRDTLVERNRIQDCYTGIRFGYSGGFGGRTYADGGCSYQPATPLETFGGLARNNFIWASGTLGSQTGTMDSGINIWNGCDTKVYNNTVLAAATPYSSIEWRFANTRVVVKNNLVSHNLFVREGAVAEQAGNIIGASANWFLSAASGDLHLTGNAPPINKGVKLPAGDCDEDIDRQRRDDSPDVGADER